MYTSVKTLATSPSATFFAYNLLPPSLDPNWFNMMFPVFHLMCLKGRGLIGKMIQPFWLPWYTAATTSREKTFWPVDLDRVENTEASRVRLTVISKRANITQSISIHYPVPDVLLVPVPPESLDESLVCMITISGTLSCASDP